MRNLTVIGIVAGLAAAAAAQRPAPDNPNVVKLSPSVTVAAAVSKLAAGTGTLVAVDPAIDEKVPASMAEGPLEAGLARIASLRHLQYRKLYLDANALPKVANKGLDAAKLKAWAVALDALGAISVGMEKGGALTVAAQRPAESPEMKEWLKGRIPVYVLYRPDEAGSGPRIVRDGPAGVRMPEPVETAGMTPEQIAEAYKAGKPVALDLATARRLKEMYPGLLPDIRLDLPEGANGRIVLMRRDERGGRQTDVSADVLRLSPPHP